MKKSVVVGMPSDNVVVQVDGWSPKEWRMPSIRAATLMAGPMPTGVLLTRTHCDRSKVRAVDQRLSRAARFMEAKDDCHRWKLPDGRYMEAIGPWRRIAAQADGMLRAAADISEGRRVGQDVWASLGGFFPPHVWPRVSDSAKRQRQLTGAEVDQATGKIGDITVHAFLGDRDALAYAVRRWLDLADVRPVFTWSEQPHTGFGVQTLFGALALRVAAALANRTERPKLCRYGDHFYAPRPRERRTTSFCNAREECKRKRWAENSRRKRAGEARQRGPYSRATESASH